MLQKSLKEVWNKMGVEMLEVSVVKLNQKDMPLYIGKMKAADLLALSAIERWAEESLEGYQREFFREKAREIARYLEECPIAMIPALLASFREGTFSEVKEDFGVLKIPRRPGAIWLLDGQQRTKGFDEIWRQLQELQGKGTKMTEEESADLKKYSELMNYEVPIVFIDSNTIADKIRKESSVMREVKATDVEGAFFFIVNKTQKPVNPSLKDELAYRTFAAGIRGIPIIEKAKWRVDVVPIVNALNRNASPLKGKINLGGVRGLGRPIRLNSFVTSLEQLFKNNAAFKNDLTPEEKKAFLKSYWSVIREMFPDAFSEDTQKEYLVLKTIGVYALNYLANDIYNWCREEGARVPSEEEIKKHLKHLKGFDWNRNTSPLAGLGGKKGVEKAYETLLKTLAENGHTKASERLEKLETSKK